MSNSEFWNILETAKEQSQGDLYEQERLITLSLAELSAVEILEFRAMYRALAAQAYKNELWAAYFLLSGSTSDDLFMDFRDWLITQGEAIFYKALEDPDSLANLYHTQRVEFDLFACIVAAYELKTGNIELPPLSKQPPLKLTGEDWDYWSQETFLAKFPQLSHKWKEKYRSYPDLS